MKNLTNKKIFIPIKNCLLSHIFLVISACDSQILVQTHQAFVVGS